MAVNIVLNGQTYTIPEPGNSAWGQNLTDYFTAIPSAVLQKSGGSFSLTADVNFGATYGLKSKYFTSVSSNAAASGVIRLASADGISWRNNANGADKTLAKNTSDQLTYAGTAFLSSAGIILPAGFPALTGDVTTSAGSVATTVAAIQGTTVSGTTGSGNVVFSDSPNFTSGIGIGVTASSTYMVYALGSANSGKVIRANNTNGGSGAFAGFRADSDSAVGTFYVVSAAGGDYVVITADSTASGGLRINSDHASTALIYLQIKGSNAVEIDSAKDVYIKNLTTAGPVTTNSSGKLTSAATLAASMGGTASDSSASTGLAKVAAGTWSYATLVNADVSASAAIALSKLAAVTASRVLVSDASGFVSASSVTTTTLGYLDATSSIQTQLNLLAPKASPTFSGTVAASADNTVDIGTTSVGFKDIYLTANVNLANTKGVAIKDSGGTSRSVLSYSSGNVVVLASRASTGGIAIDVINDSGDIDFFTGASPTSKGTIANAGSWRIGIDGVLSHTISGDPAKGIQLKFGDTTTTRYSTLGAAYSDSAAYHAWNSKQDTYNTDQWSQTDATASSLLMTLGGGTNGLQLFNAAAATSAGNKATFWGTAVATISRTGNMTLTSTSAVSSLVGVDLARTGYTTGANRFACAISAGGDNILFGSQGSSNNASLNWLLATNGFIYTPDTYAFRIGHGTTSTQYVEFSKTAMTVGGGKFILSTSQTPASAAASGTTGTIAWDTGFIYVCTASNTWKRVAIATW